MENLCRKRLFAKNIETIVKMEFSAHYTAKSKTYTRSMSHGCQIMNDSDFSDFRNDLESLGLKNGDSLRFRIR